MNGTRVDITLKQDKILGIMPAKNEEKYLPKSLLSIKNQTIKTDLLLLMDDGSTDKTSDILKNFAKKNKWALYWRLNRIQERDVGSRVAAVFIIGERIGRRLMPDWSIIIKFDADTIYEKRYIEKITKAFETDPKLGLTSGVTINEPVSKNAVRGSGMAVKRIVWDMIKLKPVLGCDSYILFKTRMLGWNAYSIQNAKMYVMRPTSSSDTKGIRYGKYKQGVESGLLGYTMPIAVRRALDIAKNHKSIRLFVSYLAGYLHGSLVHDVIEKEIRDYVKVTQYHRIVRSFRRFKL